jgi:hypothetical protein
MAKVCHLIQIYKEQLKMIIAGTKKLIMTYMHMYHIQLFADCFALIVRHNGVRWDLSLFVSTSRLTLEPIQ